MPAINVHYYIKNISDNIIIREQNEFATIHKKILIDKFIYIPIPISKLMRKPLIIQIIIIALTFPSISTN